MAHLVQQAEARSLYLDQLERLTEDPKTREVEMHVAIENALWIFGPEYSLFSSNQTLKRQIEKYLGKPYIGKHASRRPDLLLSENLNAEYLLIEFKRPDHTLTHADYQQLTGYRNELRAASGKNIRVLLLGGRKGGDLPTSEYVERNVTVMLFNDVISSARRQIAWLLRTRD